MFYSFKTIPRLSFVRVYMTRFTELVPEFSHNVYGVLGAMV
jgi:hypothetical protein